MDTACLRIKFTPLLQKSNKDDSKCCLEIVPEVSCIQNLDKLTWRRETNFIEYTIPMTYKVILKKRQALQNANDEIVKTYHSCVDLLLSSSRSTVLGSGDVSKIISDTLIFNKNTDNNVNESTDDLVDSITECHQPSDIVCNYPVSDKTTSALMQVFDTESLEDKEIIKDDKVFIKTNVPQNIKNVILDKTSLNKITSTDNVYPVFSETMQCITALLHAIPAKIPMNPESKKKLSLSPICSVSTHETPLVNKVMASKAITCKIYDSQKDLVLVGSISTPSNLSNDNQTSNARSTSIDTSGRTSSKRLRIKCRIPPEIRVAEYVQYMEEEILPLKMMVNEILNKCSALGITFSKTSSKQSLMYKTLSTYSSSPNTTKSEVIVKSNRVVYSVVFDG